MGECIDDKTPCEVSAPVLYNSADKRGPIGSGSDGSGKSLSFSFDQWLKEENLYLKGFRVRSMKYINAFQIIGAKKETQNDGTSKWLLEKFMGQHDFVDFPLVFLAFIWANGGIYS